MHADLDVAVAVRRTAAAGMPGARNRACTRRRPAPSPRSGAASGTAPARRPRRGYAAHPVDEAVQRRRAEEVADLGDHDQVEACPRASRGHVEVRARRPRGVGEAGAAPRPAPPPTGRRRHLVAALRPAPRRARPVEQPTSSVRRNRGRGSMASTRSRLRFSYHRVSTPHGSACSLVDVVQASSAQSASACGRSARPAPRSAPGARDRAAPRRPSASTAAPPGCGGGDRALLGRRARGRRARAAAAGARAPRGLAPVPEPHRVLPQVRAGTPRRRRGRPRRRPRGRGGRPRATGDDDRPRRRPRRGRPARAVTAADVGGQVAVGQAEPVHELGRGRRARAPPPAPRATRTARELVRGVGRRVGVAALPVGGAAPASTGRPRARARRRPGHRRRGDSSSGCAATTTRRRTPSRSAARPDAQPGVGAPDGGRRARPDVGEGPCRRAFTTSARPRLSVEHGRAQRGQVALGVVLAEVDAEVGDPAGVLLLAGRAGPVRARGRPGRAPPRPRRRPPGAPAGRAGPPPAPTGGPSTSAAASTSDRPGTGQGGVDRAEVGQGDLVGLAAGAASRSRRASADGSAEPDRGDADRRPRRSRGGRGTSPGAPTGTAGTPSSARPVLRTCARPRATQRSPGRLPV